MHEARLDRSVRRLTILAIIGAGLGAPATAGAHAVVRQSGSEILLLSNDATSLNTLTVRLSDARISLRDPTVDGGLDPGSCDPRETNERGFVIEALCRLAGVTLLRLDVGDREDTVVTDLPIPAVVSGGGGADILRTGPANDDVDGGLGLDQIDSGPGDDTVRVRDGLADSVRCGAGADRVEADTADDLAGDCETVARVATEPPAGADGQDRTAPRVDVGGAPVQRLRRSGRIVLTATANEAGTIAASGYLSIAGVHLPLRSKRVQLAVAGGGVRVTIRLSRAQLRRARRALRRRRRVTASLEVVATDAAGNSAAQRAGRIVLKR